MGKENKVIFTSAGTDEKEEFYVVEQTRISDINYILVTDSEEDEANAYILKEVQTDAAVVTTTYEMVEDPEELEAISKVFAQLLDDVDFE